MIRMIPFLLALLCLIMVVLEGTFTLNILQISSVVGDWQITSHFTFLFLIYIVIFFDRDHSYYAVFYAVFFGFIVDLLYTNVLGIYLFSYVAVIYLIRGMMKLLHANFLVTMLMTIIGILATDIMVYFLYNIIQVHHTAWQTYWPNRLFPTLIWNFAFSLLFYLLFTKKMQIWSEIMFDRKE